jgi:hypothetical protein
VACLFRCHWDRAWDGVLVNRIAFVAVVLLSFQQMAVPALAQASSSATAVAAVASAPAQTAAAQPCRREDTGGYSVGEILSETQTLRGVLNERQKALKKLRPLAAVIREAIDYLVATEAQDWSRCAYDGVVLVNPLEHFRVLAADIPKLRHAGLMFTFSQSAVVYVDLAAFKEQVLLSNPRAIAVGLTIFALFHEYQHIQGKDDAAAFAAHERFIDKLVAAGVITPAWGEKLHLMCAEQRAAADFNRSKSLGLLGPSLPALPSM